MTHRHRPGGRLRAAIRFNQSGARIKAVPLLHLQEKKWGKKTADVIAAKSAARICVSVSFSEPELGLLMRSYGPLR